MTRQSNALRTRIAIGGAILLVAAVIWYFGMTVFAA